MQQPAALEPPSQSLNTLSSTSPSTVASPVSSSRHGWVAPSSLAPAAAAPEAAPEAAALAAAATHELLLPVAAAFIAPPPSWSRGDAAPVPLSLPRAIAWPIPSCLKASQSNQLTSLPPRGGTSTDHASGGDAAAGPVLTPLVSMPQSPHGPPRTAHRHHPVLAPPAQLAAPAPQMAPPTAPALPGAPMTAESGSTTALRFVSMLEGPHAAPQVAPAIVPAQPMSSSISFTPQIATRPLLGGGSERNLVERKEWKATEDDQIRAAVKKYGFKWRLVAGDVPGRSDDAVRNRWNRIRSDVDPADARPHTAKNAVKREVKREATDDGEVSGGSGSGASSPDPHKPVDHPHKPERVSWTRIEDETILRSVEELGHKWSKIAERLSGRTEHAIRNRYARLQSLAVRGRPIVLSSGHGMPIGIQLIPGNR